MSLATLLSWRRKPQARHSAHIRAADDASARRPAIAPPRVPGSWTEQLIADRRYAILLDRGSSEPDDESSLASAWTALSEDMALVPAGEITVGAPESTEHALAGPAARVQRSSAFVPAFYLDRFAVTNEDFARFVATGCYDQMEFWPQQIWPSVVQFVDQSGLPGPRFWSQGRPPRSKSSHPVVGVCWYEARAFALWSGKRLPTAAEWEKAASWPADLTGRGPKTRYPWGNAFDSGRANTWMSGRRDTAPVDQHAGGCTPNGIYQMVGNVWEWVADPYAGPAVAEGIRVIPDQPMGEIRGGAFDTYFEIQATCHFRTGRAQLSRACNVGFRCTVSADQLRPRPEA